MLNILFILHINSNVATVKVVLNSISGLNRYQNDESINAGEWST